TDETLLPERRMQMLSRYIRAINTLAERPPEWFGSWQVVDHNIAQCPPVWVRLVFRLQHYANTKDEFRGKLTADLQQKVDEVYNQYKSMDKGVAERRREQEQIDTQFQQIFASDPEVRETVLQPVTREVTPKHCARFLLEIKDSVRREELIAR